MPDKQITEEQIRQFGEALESGLYETSFRFAEGSLTDRGHFEARLTDDNSLPVVALSYLRPQAAGKHGISIELTGGQTFHFDYEQPFEGVDEITRLLINHLQPNRIAAMEQRNEERERKKREYLDPQEVNIELFRESFDWHVRDYNESLTSWEQRGYDTRSGHHFQGHLIRPIVRDLRSTRYSKVAKEDMDSIVEKLEGMDEFYVPAGLVVVAEQLGLEYCPINGFDTSVYSEFSQHEIGTKPSRRRNSIDYKIVDKSKNHESGGLLNAIGKFIEFCTILIKGAETGMHSTSDQTIGNLTYRQTNDEFELSPSHKVDPNGAKYQRVIDIVTRGLTNYKIQNMEQEQEGTLYFKPIE